MDLTHLEDHFVNAGGQFTRSADLLHDRMNKVRALIFDWDGVFNDGTRYSQQGSGFSEVDSAGLHLLRYGMFLKTGDLPLVAIISGKDHQTAREWGQREQIDAAYFGVKDKEKAMLHFCNQQGITPGQCAYYFDDVLDLPVASRVGLRFAVGRLANPLLLDYIEDHHLADYISACQGHEHAVREMTELSLGLVGQYEESLKGRLEQGDSYERFLTKKEKRETCFYNYTFGEIHQES